MEDTQLQIQAFKYGNRLHYEWSTTLLEQTDSYVIVLGERGRELQHHTKGQTFVIENRTIEFFSFESWFTVSADVIDGQIKQYYCNINEPAKRNGHVVSFVDLDLDYVFRSGEWKVVDEEEFIANSVKFGYPAELIERAQYELAKLQRRVGEKQFPFDGTLERFI